MAASVASAAGVHPETSELREAERVEREIGHHDDRDESEHQQPFAIGLEPCRLEQQPAIERVADGKQHADFHQVFPDGESVPQRAGQRELCIEADDDELQLAHQQRNETQEDDRVHHPGFPLAADHPLLQQSIGDDRAQPAPRMVPANLRLQCRADRKLARAEPGECRERGQKQRSDAKRTQGYLQLRRRV